MVKHKGSTVGKVAGRINATEDRLRGLPFKSASEMKLARQEIERIAWARLEHARAMNDLVNRPEYEFWRKEFATGFVCVYSNDSDQLVRVYADSPGIKVEINKDLATSVPAGESLLASLIEPMNKSFAAIYYQARGFLPPDGNATKDTESEKLRKLKR